jgi:serine/threonine protein phosphatase PrpC
MDALDGLMTGYGANGRSITTNGNMNGTANFRELRANSLTTVYRDRSNPQRRVSSDSLAGMPKEAGLPKAQGRVGSAGLAGMPAGFADVYANRAPMMGTSLGLNVSRVSMAPALAPPPKQSSRQPLASHPLGNNAGGTCTAGPALDALVDGITLEHGYACDPNSSWREYMEDDYAVVEDFADRRGSLYCGLYDGHGGRLAVDFVAKNLHGSIERELRSGPAGDAPLEAMRRGFLKCDRQLLQCGAMQVGTTVAVCLCLPGPGGQIELHAANAGDSRILLISDLGPKRLSVDHVASDPIEAERVQGQGGRILRGRVGGVLAVTRAMGDHSLKGSCAGSGLTADPHCVLHTCGSADRFVVLASDGLWDVLSDEDAHKLVLQHMNLPPKQIAETLVVQAVARGSRDNISALVVKLR